MSLRETAILAVLVLSAVPVVAVYFRHRFGLFWWVTYATALTMSVFLAAIWGLVALRTAPGTESWALGLLACGVPILLTGYLFTGLLGRDDPRRALRAIAGPVSPLLGLGILALIFLEHPAFLVDYAWRAGTGVLTLGALGKIYLCFLLVGAVFVGRNLESAFRGAEGTVRTRLQPVVLGLFGVLGFLVYVLTTGLVYGRVDLDNLVALSLPLGVANLVTAYGFVRGTLADTSVPVSRGVVYTSFTTVAAILYFLAMGVASQLATITGWTPGHVVTASFVFLVVLVAFMFFFSNSFKRGVRRFIDRNFYISRYDYRTHWSRITGDLDPSRGIDGLLEASEQLITDVFHADAITISLRDKTAGGFRVSSGLGLDNASLLLSEDSALGQELATAGRAILLEGERHSHPLARRLLESEPGWMTETASQALAPLLSGDEILGIVGLRRKAGDPFTLEDLELLENMAAQVAAALRGAEWGRELADAREMELVSNWSNMFLHDFKNYLSPLRMIVMNMKKHMANPEFQRDAVEDISEVTDQMEELMHRLAALREGRASARQLVSLDETVATTIESLKIRQRSGIELTSRLECRGAVFGDADMLRRVVENLVTNAVDAMDGSGRLEIVTSFREASRDGGLEAVLEVKDSGEGMNQAFVRDRLFRPFATTKKKGLGLGLYQCRTIVRAHGGEIQVDTSPGMGTTFRVVLPAPRADQGDPETVEAELVLRES